MRFGYTKKFSNFRVPIVHYLLVNMFLVSALIYFQRLSELASDREISLEEYFTRDYDLQGRDVGVVKDMSTKIRKFRVNYRHLRFFDLLRERIDLVNFRCYFVPGQLMVMQRLSVKFTRTDHAHC